MKAAYINQTGPPEVIIYGDLPTPKPKPDQYLVKVAAVDVNPIDIYIRSGMVPAKLSFPYILGRDLTGTVVEAGSAVKQFKPGDWVWATNQGFAGRQGTFSEFSMRWEKAIIRLVELLRKFPELGRVRRDLHPAGIRTFGVKEFPNFLVFYRTHADEIIFLRVRYGGMDLTKMFPAD